MASKKVSLKYLNTELHNFGINPTDTKHYVPALVLLASIVVGPNTDRIAAFIKQPRSKVRELGKTIRRNGIWKQDKIDCEWFEKDTGGVAFLLDVNVAAGFMERSSHA